MNKRSLSLFTLLIAVFFGLSACDEDNPYKVIPPDYSDAPDRYDIENVPADTLDNGLQIYYVEEGYGAYPVTPRDIVMVYYTGRRTDSTIFDSSYRNGSTAPVSFTLNSQSATGFSLTEGFRLGLLGMKAGEKRTLIVPPSLGYEGTNNTLANDTLIFDVMLDEIVTQKDAY